MEEVNTIKPVHTKSLHFKGQTSDFKVVVHNNLRKNLAKKAHVSLTDGKTLTSEFDMKKTRFEIYKFSKSNLNFSSRQKSNVDLAIQLGAKPPKNKAKNYKELKVDKQMEAEKKNETSFLKQISSNFRTKNTRKLRSRATKFIKHRDQDQGILNTYGKVCFSFFFSNI